MKWGGWGVWLVLFSVCAVAQERTVRVRLFWQHPPTEIRVAPQGASLRTCMNCAPIPLTEAGVIAAKGDLVAIGSNSAPSFFLTSRLRISGEGFSPFTVENELELQAREGFLLLTLKMPLEQYVQQSCRAKALVSSPTKL